MTRSAGAMSAEGAAVGEDPVYKYDSFRIYTVCTVHALYTFLIWTADSNAGGTAGLRTRIVRCTCTSTDRDASIRTTARPHSRASGHVQERSGGRRRRDPRRGQGRRRHIFLQSRGRAPKPELDEP